MYAFSDRRSASGYSTDQDWQIDGNGYLVLSLTKHMKQETSAWMPFKPLIIPCTNMYNGPRNNFYLIYRSTSTWCVTLKTIKVRKAKTSWWHCRWFPSKSPGEDPKTNLCATWRSSSSQFWWSTPTMANLTRAEKPRCVSHASLHLQHQFTKLKSSNIWGCQHDAQICHIIMIVWVYDGWLWVINIG